LFDNCLILKFYLFMILLDVDVENIDKNLLTILKSIELLKFIKYIL